MADNHSEERALDDGAVVWGFVLGFMVSGVAVMLRLPKRGLLLRLRSDGSSQQIADKSRVLRDRINAITADPVAESIAEGKAAARTRQTRLLSAD